MYFIPEPGIDQEPVSFWRYAKWHVGKFFERTGRRWQYEAEDRCDMCGVVRHGHDHSHCDGIPF